MKKFFKIILFAFPVVVLSSCNDDNDDYGEIQSVDKIAIDSIKIVNDTMDVYSVQSVRTYSQYGSGCDVFYGYDYVHDNMNRIVTAYHAQLSGNCTQAIYTGANQFNFQPQQTGNYTFKFWKGKDSGGNDIWLEKVITVK